MLTYLRKIRKSLIESGSARKYILYAIGEVALVVIGILIALQINNWNEWRKNQAFEKNLIIELRNSIDSDYTILRGSIRQNEDFQSSCRVILSHMDKNLPYHDTLAFHFMRANLWWQLPLASESKYENIKSYGLQMIQDDTTRNLIEGLYEGSIKFINHITHERLNLYYYNTAVPILTELFEETSTPIVQRAGILPYDFEELKKSKKYRNLLKSNLRNRRLENIQYEWIFSRLERLDKRLAKEIESR